MIALARRWRVPSAERGLARLLPTILLALIAGGLVSSIFLAPGPFYWHDSVNSYYLIQKYHEGGSPFQYTVNSTATGPFYPVYAMYGGTLYALTALGGQLVGSDWFAYGLTYCVAVGAAFVGLVWLARMTGLGSDTATFVGLIYVSSAYYLSNVYGRGAWPEFIATSALPLVLAASVSVLRTANPSRKSMAILIVSTVVWSGSHLISVVYGLLFATACGAIMAIAATSPRPWPRLKSALLAVAGVSTGFAINGWFLVPQAFYARSTMVSSNISTIRFTPLTHLPILFSPFPSVSPVSTTPHLYTSLTIVPLLWALAVLFISRANGSPRPLVWLTTAFLGTLIVMMSWHKAWAAVPRFLYVIQFPYRLLTYATLLVCALAVLAYKTVSAMTGPAKDRWILAGAAVVLWQVAFASVQILESRSSLDSMRTQIDRMERDGAPPYFYGARDYRFIPDHPIAGVNSSAYRTLVRPDGSASVVGVPPPGSRVVLDVPDSPFVVVRGATRAGATRDGLLVIDVHRDQSEIILRSTVPLPAKLGQWLTIVASLFAVLLIISCTRLSRRDAVAPRGP